MSELGSVVLRRRLLAALPDRQPGLTVLEAHRHVDLYSHHYTRHTLSAMVAEGRVMSAVRPRRGSPYGERVYWRPAMEAAE